MTSHKVILNLFVANKLIQRGFPVIEVKPSTKVRGRVVFIFEVTLEFDKAMAEISKDTRRYHKYN